MIEEGDKAPDINVAATNGKSVNLAAPGGRADPQLPV